MPLNKYFPIMEILSHYGTYCSACQLEHKKAHYHDCSFKLTVC
jgi:hypothetical protein